MGVTMKIIHSVSEIPENYVAVSSFSRKESSTLGHAARKNQIPSVHLVNKGKSRGLLFVEEQAAIKYIEHYRTRKYKTKDADDI